MNIRKELLKLQENASLLDRAEFAAKFMTIADEYQRLQLLQQTPCTAHVCPSCGSLDVYIENNKWSCLTCMDSGQIA